MRFRAASIFIILLFYALLPGCKPVKPQEPEYSVSQKRFVPEMSVINLPVDIPLKVLEDQVNRKMGNLVYEDMSYTSPSVDDLKLLVLKKRPVTVGISGSELMFTIPLNIWGKARWDPCSICPEVEKETAFDVDVFLKSKLDIQKDYQFKVTTSSGGFEWKSKPVIAIGPINLPISSLLEGVLEKQIAAVTREIDAHINSAVNLRQQVEEMWMLAQEPILLDDSSQTWLRVDPERFFIAPITGTKTAIRIPLGLEAFVQTHIGQKPDVPVKKPLPDLKTVSRSTNTFVVQVRTVLRFEDATRIAQAQLAGQEFTYGKKKIKAEGIRIYGKGDRAFIHLVFSGSLKGELYLSGIPAYATETDEFSFTGLDYDIHTRNLLVRAGSWLLNSTFRTLLEEKLRFSFKTEMDELRKSLRERLKDYRYKNLFSLKGEMGKMSVQDIYVAEGQFDLALRLNGTANVKIEDLGF